MVSSKSLKLIWYQKNWERTWVCLPSGDLVLQLPNAAVEFLSLSPAGSASSLLASASFRKAFTLSSLPGHTKDYFSLMDLLHVHPRMGTHTLTHTHLCVYVHTRTSHKTLTLSQE